MLTLFNETSKRCSRQSYQRTNKVLMRHFKSQDTLHRAPFHMRPIYQVSADSACIDQQCVFVQSCILYVLK